MTNYCLGVRINGLFQERVCEHRERCPFYYNVVLSVAFAHPEEYLELETYNNNECKYFDNYERETNENQRPRL